MRKSATLVIAAIAAALLPGPAWAGDYVNARVGAKLSLPSCWHLTDELPSEVFFSCTGSEDLGAAVEIIKDAKLADPGVVHRIDLSNRVVTVDRTMTSGGLRARRIDGKARSEGTDLVFYSISLDPGGGRPILQLAIWDTPEHARRPDVHHDIEHMLASLAPIR
jgi:hypothetical protein